MKKLLKKWSEMPDSAKSSIAFMLSSFLTLGLNILTTPIFTRLVDQTQYGIIGTYNSWLSILDVFALAGLTSAGVFNVGLNEFKNKRNEYISSIVGLCNVITLLVFAVLFSVKYVIGDDFILPWNLLVLMLIHFIFSPAYMFWITREKYECRYKASTLITLISAVISLASSLIFVVLSKSENLASVRLWSSEAALLLVYLPIYIIMIYKGRRPVNLSIWKRTLVFALPLIPHYLAQHVMASADIIMISELVSDADAGIYSVVSTIGKVATIVWSAINVSLISIIFDAIDRGDYKKLHGLTASLVLGYGVVCFSVVLLAPEVLAILAPASYKAGVYVVPPIACVSFISCLYNLFANIEFYYKKSFGIAFATITASVLNVVLNFILIPKFSYLGAAYTTLISNVVLILIHYIGYKRATKDPVSNDKLLFIISAIIVAVSLASSLLYINNIVRYVIVGSVLAVIAVKHKFIISKIKSLYAKGSVEALSKEEISDGSEKFE